MHHKRAHRKSYGRSPQGYKLLGYRRVGENERYHGIHKEHDIAGGLNMENTSNWLDDPINRLIWQTDVISRSAVVTHLTLVCSLPPHVNYLFAIRQQSARLWSVSRPHHMVRREPAIGYWQWGQETRAEPWEGGRGISYFITYTWSSRHP